MTLPHDDDSDFDGLDPETRGRRLKLSRELEAALANPGMNPVLSPDARTPDVWFDERKRETGSLVKPHATAPLLGSDHDQVPATNGLSRPSEHPRRNARSWTRRRKPLLQRLNRLRPRKQPCHPPKKKLWRKHQRQTQIMTNCRRQTV